MPNVTVNCKHDGCAKKADGGKGYCAPHYRAWRRGELKKPRYQTCRAEGCHKRVAGRGRCEEHFKRDFPGKSAAIESAGSVEPTPVSG